MFHRQSLAGDDMRSKTCAEMILVSLFPPTQGTITVWLRCFD